MSHRIVELEAARLARRAKDPDTFSWVFRNFPGGDPDGYRDDFLCIFTRRLLERAKDGLGVTEETVEIDLLNLAQEAAGPHLDKDCVFAIGGVKGEIEFAKVDLDGRGTLRVFCLREETAETPANVARATAYVRAACREVVRQRPSKRWTP